MKQKKMEDFKRGREFEGWPPPPPTPTQEARSKVSCGASGDGGDGSSSGSGGDDDLKNASAVGLAGLSMRNINAESNMMHISRAEFDGDRVCTITVTITIIITMCAVWILFPYPYHHISGAALLPRPPPLY